MQMNKMNAAYKGKESSTETETTAAIPGFQKALLWGQLKWDMSSRNQSLVSTKEWHVSFTDPTTSDVISVIILAGAWFGLLILNILWNV